MLSGNRNRAISIAEEGLEAVRNIRDDSFSNLVVGTHGINNSEGEWQFSGSSDSVDIYTRTVTVSDINSDTKQVTSAVS
jgi:hypothetical protein